METEHCWTFEKDEMLIELVKNSPGLYNIQSPHYSDNIYKKKMWNDIERMLQLPAPKTRWESLRAQYRKYLAKLKTKSGQKGFKISKWRHFDQMQFINLHINVEIPQLPFVDEETSNENTWLAEKTLLSSSIVDNESNDHIPIPDSNDNEADEPVNDSVNISGNILKTKKRKLGAITIKENTSAFMKYLLEKQQQENAVHPMDHFFSLMAITVKKFSSYDQYLVKTTVFNLVSQLEEKYLKPPSKSFLPSISVQDNQASPSQLSQSTPSPTFNSRFDSKDFPSNCPLPPLQNPNIGQESNSITKCAIRNPTQALIQDACSESQITDTLAVPVPSGSPENITLVQINPTSYLCPMPQLQTVKIEYQPND